MRRLPRLIPFIITFLLVALALSDSAPVLAATPLILPVGFVDEPVFPSGNELLAPRAFTFTPDGRILALERGSAASNDSNLSSIRVFKNGAILPTRAYTFDTCGDAERGALGIAVDPDFVNNGYIYVYYTRQATSGSACGYNTFVNGIATGPRNRISRLTMVGDVVTPGSEVVLIDSIMTDVGYHNGGDLHFGLDGYLYASTGEGGYAWTSTDKNLLNGKIIRILPTAGPAGGYTTTGNPYDTEPGARYCSTIAPFTEGQNPGTCREIFAKGFRNPFRFTIQPTMAGIPGAGSPFVGDVGGGVWEEIDQVQSSQAGGDYGHPVREGYCPGGVLCSPPYGNGGYINPVYAYAHKAVNTNFDSAVIGGDFYIGTAGYPAAYVNNYFFSDFARGFIDRLSYAGGQWVRSAFATGGNGIIGLKRGPDGNLYYLAFTSESLRLDGIRRIRYTGSTNQRPTAQISVNTLSGPLSTVYTFSAVGSTDPENNAPFSYFWDFGDGTTLTTSTPTTPHTYASATNEIASVTVTDHGNPAMNSAPATITVYPGNTAPSGTIVLTNTTDGARTATFYAGDTWDFSAANVTDDVMAPPPVVTWEIVFHHRSHTHPFIPLVQGNSGQFTLPNTGELDPVIYYRVHLYLTDSRGQRTEFTQDITPVTRVVKFDSVPGGGKVTIEGATFTTPLSLTRVVGMHFAATVPSPQTIAGVSYSFQSWSQGGNQQQTITVPAVDTTYMVNFTPPRNYFTTHTPTLTWNQVTGTLNYDVQIGTNSSYTGATIYPVGNVLSFTPSTPLNNGEYFWRVRACSAVATCGAWSASDIFIVDAP